MIILEALSFFLFVVTALSAPPQTTRTDLTALKIPNITKGSREDCGVKEFLVAKSINFCDYVLPIDTKNFFLSSRATLCFGVYDTLYELCQYQNLSELEIPVYTADSFCNRANKALVNYNFRRGGPVFQEWVPRLRNELNSMANCTEICCHGTDVDPMCSTIVASLERLPAAMAAAAAAHVTNTTKSDAKISTPSAFQRPSSPTEGSQPASSKVKPLEQSKPMVVAKNEPNVEVEEAAKPPADKAVPQAVPVKTEQVAAKSDEPLPPEPKLENPESDPDMMGPEGTEDDDGPGLEARQPDPLPDQQSDLNLAKDAPSETKPFPNDESGGNRSFGKQPVDTFAGEPYLTISKKEDSADPEETNMVTYFVLMTGGALLFYIGFHNKNKLLALALEGRRTGRRGGRHSSAAYSKLHSNLEETIASGPTSPSATHVLY